MKYLIDTNILSELRKKKPNQNVVKFINSISPYNIYISCITIGEIQKGISDCKDNTLKGKLNEWFETFLIKGFEDRIIDIDINIIQKWGHLMAEVKNLPIIDSLLAATCLSHNLVIITRNVKDFNRITELEIINPFG